MTLSKKSCFQRDLEFLYKKAFIKERILNEIKKYN